MRHRRHPGHPRRGLATANSASRSYQEIAALIGLLLGALLGLAACDSGEQAVDKAAPVKAAVTPAVTPAPTTPSKKTLADFQAAAERFNLVLEVPDFETTPGQLKQSVDNAIAAADDRLAAMAAQPRDSLNFDNAVRILDDIIYPVVKVSERIDLIQETSRDADMRDAALAMNKALQKWFVKTNFREDVYRVVKAYNATGPRLEGEDRKLLEDLLRDYRRRGMDLPAEQRAEVERLQTELRNMQLEFKRNVNQAKTPLVFTVEELAGLPEDILANEELKTGDNEYTIDANVTWQVLAVLQNARSEATRKRVVVARYRRAMEENVPLFTRMLKHRARIAAAVGYDSWADYRIETKMAKTAATARDFLQRLNTKLEPKYRDELSTFRKLKVAQTGDPDAEVHLWDMRYYQNQLKKTRYQVDAEKLKVFFPYEAVLKGMFAIFEQIFGIKIEEVEPPYKWVDDLTLHVVSDAASGEPLGLFYLDMFPREGKYNHFAQFGITPGKLLANGKYQRPVVSLVCNFPPPTAGKPSLLTHSHVRTLFHEFGHVLHSLLTQAKYVEFSGTSVPRDFVEAPSQMLENWIWDKSVLDGFAAHYRDPTRKIPTEVLEKMEAARLATIGSLYRRQLSFGLLDLAVHTTRDDKVFEDFVAVTNRVQSDVYMPVPDGTAFVAAFGHLAGGYDAGYYGYAWAHAISADMASVFEKSPGGLMDRETGMRLRKEIYAVGGSRDINDSIKAFLGRERSLDPFFKKLGL